MSFGGNHISIYLGNGKAIDAPVPGKTVQIRDAWEQQPDFHPAHRARRGGKGAPAFRRPAARRRVSIGPNTSVQEGTCRTSLTLRPFLPPAWNHPPSPRPSPGCAPTRPAISGISTATPSP
ncbi:hypothetical protein [Arthrobacter humicola]|uniref:hypothetical protein n=1 Tax=Arthrobacter humicola TaxID=409291 RepID=UPI001FADC101